MCDDRLEKLSCTAFSQRPPDHFGPSVEARRAREKFREGNRGDFHSVIKRR
jgi:hypothetical protein